MAVRLVNAPIGLFEIDGVLVLKTQYCTKHEDGTVTADCYIVDSGEYFWGGVESAEERNNLMVTPVDMPTFTPPNEWVSVEERLPDAEKEVRLFCVTPNGYKYQCQGFYVPPGMRRDDSDYSWDWECCDQYDEDSDDYFVNPGWYERGHNWDEYSAFGIAGKVTHWMPLPAPPDCRPPEGEEDA